MRDQKQLHQGRNQQTEWNNLELKQEKRKKERGSQATEDRSEETEQLRYAS